jgi:lipopolysaccharide assembly outer membrane protein LptD (OstA)
MLLPPARFTHHMFLEGQTNPVQRQTCRPLAAFHASATLACHSFLDVNHRAPSPSIPLIPMLGYPTVFIDCMLRLNLHLCARTLSALRPFLFLTAFLVAFAGPPARLATAQQVHLPSLKGGIVDLEAKTQSRRGDVITADGDVDIHFGDRRLRTNHVEYNSKTFEAVPTGHVQLDYNNEHLDADEAQYNVSTDHGLFDNVRGSVRIERRPNPAILISDDPLYFEARDVKRFPGDVYLIQSAWITICDPEYPKWQFYAPNARIHLGKTVALINANIGTFGNLRHQEKIY